MISGCTCISYSIHARDHAESCPVFQSIWGGKVEPKETVNHPAHYGGGENPYEHIKVVRAWGLNYELGNATKYICRAGKKNAETDIEDLEKARWYLDAEIQRRKAERFASGKDQSNEATSEYVDQGRDHDSSSRPRG